MPVLLDTDHLSILEQRIQPERDRLRARLDALAPDDVGTTIVSFQEQVRGWMSFLNRARTPEQIIVAYAKLESIWRQFCRMNVVSFTREAQDCFMGLRKRRVRVATLDLRIASIALVTDSTRLSRNLRDFRQVPELMVEDWTN